VHARKTPTTVVAIEITALFQTQRAKGWSLITEAKLAQDHWAGHGMTARSRSRAVGSAGTSAMASVCFPEKAIVMTQRTG
jgi:hypothetical protein